MRHRQSYLDREEDVVEQESCAISHAYQCCVTGLNSVTQHSPELLDANTSTWTGTRHAALGAAACLGGPVLVGDSL